jgi:hypothetical protein
MVPIFLVAESYQGGRVGDGFLLPEKPFLEDRFAGPSTIPASRRNGWLPDFLAFSNSYRTILPAGIRTVILLLICLKCNAPPAP